VCLAGTFVMLARHTNALRALLHGRGMRQGCIPRMMTTMDCSACQQLSCLAYCVPVASEVGGPETSQGLRLGAGHLQN
jgi:hypothetical protein